MALVIDASSPAAHAASSTTAANTCASFVPPDSPLLLAMWAGDSNHFSILTAPTITDSSTLGWVSDGWDYIDSGTPVTDGQVAAFHALVAGSPGASTVTVTTGETNSGQMGSLLKVYVILGHSPVAPVGVTGVGRQTSGSSLSDGYTGSITGGQGFMIVSDWNAGATAGWTADTGCTIQDKGTLTGEISYAVLRRTDPDGVLGAATTLGMSGLPTGGQYHWAYLEVISLEAALAAEGQSGYPSTGQSPPMY